jgi:hypothetical protein
MEMVKTSWGNLCKKIFLPRKVELKVYSNKAQEWVTVSIPKGRRDLIPMELSKLEAKLEAEGLVSMSDVEERNQWIRNLEVRVSISQSDNV